MPQEKGELERKLQGLIDKSEDIVSTLKEVNSHIILPKGKYVVDFDIVVNPRGTLEIDPGTEIYFGPNAGIINYGLLIAKGTKDDNILFTASETHWRNISILTKISSDSVLEYCKITKSAGRGDIPETKCFGQRSGVITGALYISGSSPSISYCTIEDNSSEWGGAGIYISGSHSLLVGNTIRNNCAKHAGGGIQISNSTPIPPGPTFQRNTIMENEAGMGGAFYIGNSNVTLEGNTIIKNRAYTAGGLHFEQSYLILDGKHIWYKDVKEMGGDLVLLDQLRTVGGNTIQENTPEDLVFWT